jgi:uncharacterized protein (TIGR00730 family)
MGECVVERAENDPQVESGPAAAGPRCVLVFCASSRSCDVGYHRAAAELGRRLALAGDTIVYGGGGVGSMGSLADAGLAVGGRVVGIQPRFMQQLEWTHPGLSELVLVEDMQERKREMLRIADAVVTLPGGSGTFEELFEAITSKRLGLFRKPIVLVNQDGFFDPFLSMMQRSVDERFMHDAHLDMWQVVESVAEVCEALSAAPEWSDRAIEFASP